MAELLKDLTCEGFADITLSDAPAPGGGSVSALAGALGAALAGMVANLTIGKKKYEEVQDEMKELAAQAAALQKELIADIDKDSTSFNIYMDAIGMPKDTEEQKAARKAKMQEGLKAAAQVPLSCAET
ncbi:MAG: cyclodeaminase/cyclohydrolase family protein, partial [Clostridium sp.]|nr:cyclodeaminase/cyclohydrolase family protein [Clostridium sp.]